LPDELKQAPTSSTNVYTGPTRKATAQSDSNLQTKSKGDHDKRNKRRPKQPTIKKKSKQKGNRANNKTKLN